MEKYCNSQKMVTAYRKLVELLLRMEIEVELDILHLGCVSSLGKQ
jgi:hypothetical protein